MTARRKQTRRKTGGRTPARRRRAPSRRGTKQRGRGGADVLLHVSGVLAIVCGFLALLLLRLANAPVWDATASGYVVLGVLAVAGWGLLQLGALRAPPQSTVQLLLAAVAFLVGFGIMVQHRVKGIDFMAPTPADLAYPVGVVVLLALFLLLRNGRYEWLAAPGHAYALVGIAGMVVLLGVGTRYRGAVFAAGRMTPTELLKPVMAVYVAWFLAGIGGPRRGKRKTTTAAPRRWWGFVAVWSVLMLLLVWQRDLGMIAILNGMFFFALFVATSNAWVLPLAGVATLVAGAAAACLLPYVRTRVEAWLNPFGASTGAGWQLLQSLAALYNGGLAGAGLGEGSPQTIPVASSDFIYAAIGEELGLVGCIILVAVLSLLISAGFRTAATAGDRFGRLLATTLTSVIALQTLLNIGGTTKALPLTGVPLPFLSHGGTSLLVSFACVGILAAVAVPAPKGGRPRR